MLDKFKNSPFAGIARKIGEHAIRKGKTSGLPPVEIAKVVHRALTLKNPRTRYLAAPGTLKYRIIKVLSDKRVDALVLKELRRD